ncbi:hypothetical protein D3C74_443220 [compost metagenome]
MDPRNGLPGAVKMWPTPQASDDRDRGNLSNPSIQRRIANRKQLNLSMVVKGDMWPTPTASQDWKPIRPLAPSEATGSHGTMLVGAVGNNQPEYVGKQLNPNWVECLMGFPMGWTNIDVQK